MRDPVTFEARLGDAFTRYVATKAVDVDPLAIASAIGMRATPSRGLPQLLRSRRLAWFVIVAVLALAAAAAYLVGSKLFAPHLQISVEPAGTLLGIDGPMVTLDDGRVLSSPINNKSIARIFDPSTGAGMDVGSGPDDLVLSTFIVLPDGRVFLLGWENAPGAPTHSIAWTFDPSTNLLSTPVPTLDERVEADAVLLDDGRVLVFGGIAGPENFAMASGSEIYDPAPGSFESGPDGLPLWSEAQVVALPGQKLLLVGGSVFDKSGAGHYLGDVLLLDLQSGETAKIGTLQGNRPPGPHVVRLPDGGILLISRSDTGPCGRHGYDPQSAWVFDPATGTLGPTLYLPHRVGAAVGLPDGRVVLSGNWQVKPGGCASEKDYVSGAWLAIYDPATGLAAETRDALTGRGDLPFELTGTYGYSSGVLLNDGRVLLVGEGGNADFITVGPR